MIWFDYLHLTLTCQTYSVPLREHYWTHLDQSGPRPASRADLLTALSNVEAILVRATHSTPTQASFLSDVSLDTAVSQPTGQSQAREVEECRCPTEYRGSSCEVRTMQASAKEFSQLILLPKITNLNWWINKLLFENLNMGSSTVILWESKKHLICNFFDAYISMWTESKW